MALLRNGEVVAWGANLYGQAEPPPALGDVVEICAGAAFTAARTSDGTLYPFGTKAWGLANPPAGSFTAMACGADHALALAQGGSVQGWGRNDQGQLFAPVLTGVVTLAAGTRHRPSLPASPTC